MPHYMGLVGSMVWPDSLLLKEHSISKGTHDAMVWEQVLKRCRAPGQRRAEGKSELHADDV